MAVRDGDDSWFAVRGVGAADFGKELERHGDDQNESSIDSARALQVDSPSYLYGNAGSVTGDGNDSGVAEWDDWICVCVVGALSQGAAGRSVFVAGVWGRVQRASAAYRDVFAAVYVSDGLEMDAANRPPRKPAATRESGMEATGHARWFERLMAELGWAFLTSVSTTPAADFCCMVRVNYSTLSPESETCSRSPEISSIAFPAQPLCVLDRYGLRDHWPARPTLTPPIRFLYIGSRVCSTLPSNPTSRRRPCASLSLHLYQVVKRTFTSKLSNVLGGPRKEQRRKAAATSRIGSKHCEGN